MHPEVLVL